VRLSRGVDAAVRDECERLAAKVNAAGLSPLGSELRWAAFDPDADHLVRLLDDRGVLRAVSWVTRQAICVSSCETPVAGIRGVMTDPDERRRGYGRAVMERSRELMVHSFADCEFALLFSTVMAVPFYEALGWRAIPGPLTCDQPGGPVDYTALFPTAPVMALPLRPSAVLPAGPVQAVGFPW
jgi:GNAT superfamily N-acetyltransferase